MVNFCQPARMLDDLFLFIKSAVSTELIFDEPFVRHCLPPDYVLKSDRKKMEEQREQISIEDLVERERAALGSNVTKVWVSCSYFFLFF